MLNVKSIIFSFLLIASTAFNLLSYDSKQDAFFDSAIDTNQFSYIYSPGFMGSEILMGRYCPEFIASTGEKITWRSGGHVIGKNHTAVIFPEINLRKPRKVNFNPISAVIENLRMNLFPLIQRVFQEKLEFDVKDSDSKYSVVNYSFNLSQANLGQKKDIKALKKTYHKHLNKYPNKNIILYGDSRGAASTFNFIAKYKPANVKAAVLDGIYDNIDHCIKHFLYEDKSPETEKCMRSLVSTFVWSYNSKGPFTIDIANIITDDIPLLFVTSLKDGLTPPQGAFNVYAKLKKRGFKNIHLLVLEKALHPAYMIDNEKDKQTYESVVHAFYKHYNLPHNIRKAQEGQKAFEETQISVEDLKIKYADLPKCKFCNL